MKLEIFLKDGRKETFDSVVSFYVTVERTAGKDCLVSEVAQTYYESKLFEVDPQGIDRRCFEKPRRNKKQEWTRGIILEALDEVDKHPEKYATIFYTLIPEKNWNGYKTIEELKEYANNLGGHIADWVEQALEWGQKISNGESWETICNNADAAKWYRMIAWKNGDYRIVGGSFPFPFPFPVSVFHNLNYTGKIYDTVPLVALKKK